LIVSLSGTRQKLLKFALWIWVCTLAIELFAFSRPASMERLLAFDWQHRSPELVHVLCPAVMLLTLALALNGAGMALSFKPVGLIISCEFPSGRACVVFMFLTVVSL
jgi:hypothetical protein